MTKKQKMKKILFLPLLMIFLLTLSSCQIFRKEIVEKVEQTVENHITNTTVDYNNLTIDELEECVQNTVKMVEKAVIGVSLKTVNEVMINGEKVTSEDTEGIGSGVIYRCEEIKNASGELINYQYYALTNHHVVSTDKALPTKVYVYLGYEDVEIASEVLGSDEKADVAVITFKHYTKIQPVEFADSDKINKGQFVIAIGNPDGYDYFGSVSFGVISGTSRYISSDTDKDGTYDYNGCYIQTDAAINPGNSGGGLFTIDGKLLGINALKLVSDEIENMGFAIPINIAKTIATEYLEKKIPITRPMLGITATDVRTLTNAVIASNGLQPLPDIYGITKPYGLYVRSIVDGGSLASSNVKPDDIILTFDGEKLINMNILSAKLNALTDYHIGSVVTITYYSRTTKTIVSENITLK